MPVSAKLKKFSNTIPITKEQQEEDEKQLDEPIEGETTTEAAAEGAAEDAEENEDEKAPRKLLGKRAGKPSLTDIDQDLKKKKLEANKKKYVAKVFEKPVKHDVLRLPHSRLDLRRYYVNDDVVKARTSPFYENERNTITVPLIFLHFPLFDHRQHSIFQYSLMGGVLAHELSHAFEHEGILFDADGNESPVGLQIRDTKAFQNAIKCAAQTPAVSLKERLADLNGLQLAYDTFFGLDHNSQLYTYRPYAFESEFQAPQLFHLSYAQFFCGILPPVLGHDRDDVRVNVNVANLRQFSLDFKCPPPAVQSPPVCELWRPTASSILVSA
ncbi:blast:Endothelin-converting enzyme 1 [Drosophila guanche]|uniref:Blast:Endothelin-converting enzyme 1 n=1 Tax=Drosophila guanche TaxID=7266 RepID=A0A3B0IZW9_DROGU|nr:blast:Endothelin-converting enzyme 1 [Drosophila guanche]